MLWAKWGNSDAWEQLTETYNFTVKPSDLEDIREGFLGWKQQREHPKRACKCILVECQTPEE